MQENMELPRDADKALDALEEFLNMVLDETGLDLGFDIDACDPDNPVDIEAPDIVVNFSGPDLDLLFDDHAELLRSLEYLGHRWARLQPRQAARIRFDADGYRSGRVAELSVAARSAAEKVRSDGTPFRFQPMNARERRIIHLIIEKEDVLVSTSEGEGYDRAAVIETA